MKSKQFIEALNHLDDKYYSEPLEYRKSKRNHPWVKWVAAAACLCLIVLGIITITRLQDTAPLSDNGYTLSEDGIHIPRMEVSLSASDSAKADMIAFFIYEGRTYVQYEYLGKDLDLIDGYLATTTGLIDEWTPKEGYVDLAGNIQDNIYSIRGINPDFMLCTRMGDGQIQTYINNNGMTIKTGADILEKGFHLSEQFAALNYQTSDAWYNSTDEMYTLKTEYQETVMSLLSALSTSEFTLSTDRTSPYGDPQYHLFLQLKNGMQVHLRTYSGGYVSCQGIWDCYLQIEESLYNKLLTLLKSSDARTPVPVSDSALTYEDCLHDSRLGKYLPIYQPAGTEFQNGAIYYNIEQTSGKLLNSKEMYVGFTGEKSDYYIEISNAADYVDHQQAYPAYPLYDLSSLTVDDIRACTEIIPENTKPQVTRLGVRVDDKVILLSAYDITGEECYKLLTSINERN